MSYSQEQFDQDVRFFNLACGRTLPTTQEEFDSQVVMQQWLIHEEVVETQVALINQDMVEVLDGIVDVLFTTSWLVHILNSCKDSGFEVSGLLNVWLSTLPVNQVGVLFDHDVVIEAMQRVAVNNITKFTADKHRADVWAIKSPEYVLSEVVIDGVIYFCLKDENGKVRKHFEFTPVDLGGLI